MLFKILFVLIVFFIVRTLYISMNKLNEIQAELKKQKENTNKDESKEDIVDAKFKVVDD